MLIHALVHLRYDTCVHTRIRRTNIYIHFIKLSYTHTHTHTNVRFEKESPPALTIAFCLDTPKQPLSWATQRTACFETSCLKCTRRLVCASYAYPYSYSYSYSN